MLLSAVAVTLAITACSSATPSTSAASSAAAGGGTGTVPFASGLTKPLIKVGLIASLSGAGADNNLGLPGTVTAWQDWTNAHGGIAGHPVQVIVEDDQSQGPTGLTAVQNMVQSDHVVALAGIQGSFSEASFAQYLEQKQIPVVGGASYTAAIWDANPMFFSLFPGSATGISVPFKLAQQQGLKKVVHVVCSETPSCLEVNKIAQPYATQMGLTMLPTVTAGSTQPSYAAQCQQLKSAGAQEVSLSLPEQTDPRLISNCITQGFTPSFWAVDGVSNVGSLASVANLNMYGTVETLPWFYKGPQTADLHSALNQYGGGDSQPKYQEDSVGMTWAALQGFKAALANAPAGTVTSQDVLKGLYSFKGETLGGLLPSPVTFTAASQAKPRPDGSCTFLIRLKDGKWSMPNGTKPFCV